MKTLSYIIMILGISSLSFSQDLAKDALGVRLSASGGFGAETSYQHAFTEHNRMELNLGAYIGKNYGGFKLTALDQWVWNLQNDFNWYVGAGGGIASYYYDNNEISGSNIRDNYTFLFLAADIGIEYDFTSPFLLSLDFRPELGLSDSNFRNDNFEIHIGFGIRYQF